MFLILLVSRAGLEPATTALKVRQRRAHRRFHAQNRGLWGVRKCIRSHRMLAVRYQPRCQTNAGHRNALAVV